MSERKICAHCRGEHEPDTPDTYVIGPEKIYMFSPFQCVCCGIEVCARQFAHGFRCGICDVGACDPENKAYDPKYKHD